MKLTKRTVEAAPVPDKGVTFYWDSTLPGFGLRVTHNGVRSYIAQSRVNGKTRRVTLARHGIKTADEARAEAKQVLAGMSSVTSPTDPVAERRKRRALAITLREVVNGYLADRRGLKERSRADIRRHLDGTFKSWAKLPVSSITRDMVARRFRDMSKTAPAQANQAFRLLRAWMNYAIGAYRTPDGAPVLLHNPVAVLSDTKVWNDIKARNSYVPADKLGEWWSVVQEMRADPSLTTSSRTAVDLVALLTLTGLRLGEACSLTREQVDLEDSSLRLVDTKNRTSVTLPLSDLTVEVLRGRPEGKWLFPARSGDGHIQDCRSTLERIGERTGVMVTPHDLRRTFRSVAGKCHVELWRTKALMNHKQTQDVTLNNYTDLEDVRYLRPEANRIAEHLEDQRRIAEADNVTTLEVRA